MESDSDPLSGVQVQAERLRQLPPYIFSQVVAAMRKERRLGNDVVNLGMGNPDQPTPQIIVDKVQEVLTDSKLHRYSIVKGIVQLRASVERWYKRRYNVSLNVETEIAACIGSKEGIVNFLLAILNPGEVAMVPNPSYPAHLSSVVLSGATLLTFPMNSTEGFLPDLERAYLAAHPAPKVVLLSYPHNPTTAVADIEFLSKVVAFARKRGVILIHDFAYSDIAFDGYKPPSILEVPGAKDVAIEFTSMSKSFNMAGWRVGYAAGCPRLIEALEKIKSYTDYGIFAPLQVASILALDQSETLTPPVVEVYQQRRDTLIEGLQRLGLDVESPKATMYVWLKLPPPWDEKGSLAFSMELLRVGGVTVSPGVAFGDGGEGYVRIALVENTQRIRQAIRGFKKVL